MKKIPGYYLKASYKSLLISSLLDSFDGDDSRKKKHAHQNRFTRKKAVNFLKVFDKYAWLLSGKVVLVYTSVSNSSEYTPNIF